MKFSLACVVEDTKFNHKISLVDGRRNNGSTAVSKQGIIELLTQNKLGVYTLFGGNGSTKCRPFALRVLAKGRERSGRVQSTKQSHGQQSYDVCRFQMGTLD